MVSESRSSRCIILGNPSCASAIAVTPTPDPISAMTFPAKTRGWLATSSASLNPLAHSWHPVPPSNRLGCVFIVICIAFVAGFLWDVVCVSSPLREVDPSAFASRQSRGQSKMNVLWLWHHWSSSSRVAALSVTDAMCASASASLISSPSFSAASMASFSKRSRYGRPGGNFFAIGNAKHHRSDAWGNAPNLPSGSFPRSLEITTVA
mmetsp:Transcript_11514/g.38054  ORF Transcript_11514/g.38054 Transcript_11514/m.38054 type:complete len:207 (+) Transcript_11514:591-1211(+)